MLGSTPAKPMETMRANGVKPLASAEWLALLEGAGLSEIVARTYEIDIQNETRGILRRYGLGEMLRVLSRIVSLYARNPAYRTFVRAVREVGVTPENLDQYFGYGVYVGRK